MRYRLASDNKPCNCTSNALVDEDRIDHNHTVNPGPRAHTHTHTETDMRLVIRQWILAEEYSMHFIPDVHQ